MVTVAIAGGTGKLGRTIAEVLDAGIKHKVIILSRQTSNRPDLGFPILSVDYTDVEDLTTQLEANSVHTVISTLQVNSPESGTCEINLVRAASQSRETKRFITSEWSIPVPDSRLHLPHQAIRHATIEELRGTDLEWTTVYNGFIMDSFGIPHVKSYMGPIGIHIAMPNKAAAIPGSGNEKMMFTYSIDIARFVEAALDLPKWEEQMFCYGDICTYNEVLELAERNTGVKFSVTHDRAEELEKGKMTELPSHTMVYSRMPKPAAQRRFSMFGLYSIYGYFGKPVDRLILNDVFPHIETTSVADMMGLWKDKN